MQSINKSIRTVHKRKTPVVKFKVVNLDKALAQAQLQEGNSWSTALFLAWMFSKAWAGLP